jgi:hypothetical protein
LLRDALNVLVTYPLDQAMVCASAILIVSISSVPQNDFQRHGVRHMPRGEISQNGREAIESLKPQLQSPALPSNLARPTNPVHLGLKISAALPRGLAEMFRVRKVTPRCLVVGRSLPSSDAQFPRREANLQIASNRSTPCLQDF